MAYRPRTRIWTPAALGAGIVSLSDLKDHLRVTADDEDAYIQGLGLAATYAVERWTQRLLTVRAATLNLTCLPSGQCPIELPGGTVASVTSVTADGVAITGCTAIGASPALLIPAADWPAVTGEGYPVTIVYQVGMATVPADLVHAVKMIAADMYDARSSTVAGPTSKAMVSAEYLMAPHRIWAAA